MSRFHFIWLSLLHSNLFTEGGQLCTSPGNSGYTAFLSLQRPGIWEAAGEWGGGF